MHLACLRTYAIMPIVACMLCLTMSLSPSCMESSLKNLYDGSNQIFSNPPFQVLLRVIVGPVSWICCTVGCSFFFFCLYSCLCSTLWIKEKCLDYVNWVKDDKLFHLLVQITLSSWGHTFPRLKLQYKPSF